jgi:hypothetical protein
VSLFSGRRAKLQGAIARRLPAGEQRLEPVSKGIVSKFRRVERTHVDPQQIRFGGKGVRHCRRTQERASIGFEARDAGRRRLPGSVKPRRIGLNLRDALLAGNPHASIGIFEESILIGGVRPQSVLKLQVNPILRLEAHAVRDMHSFRGPAPDPSSGIALQEVRVNRVVTRVGGKIGHSPLRAFPLLS